MKHSISHSLPSAASYLSSPSIRRFLAVGVFLASTCLGEDYLTITSDPPGASIEIDGIVIGKTPDKVEASWAYHHGSRSVFGVKHLLGHQLHVHTLLDGYLRKEKDLATGPHKCGPPDGIYYANYFILKATNFNFIFHRAATRFTGQLQATLSDSGASSLWSSLSTEEISRRTNLVILVLNGPERTGSRLFVTESDVAVTNAHIAGGQSNLMATTCNGQTVNVGFEYLDPSLDIALVRAERRNCQHLPLADLSTIQTGSSVVAIGTLSHRFRNTLTKGVVSTIGQMPKERGIWIQTDAAINSGISSGPLLSMVGEVVEINTQKLFLSADGRPLEGIGLALSGSDLLSVLRRFYRAVFSGAPVGQPNQQNEGSVRASHIALQSFVVLLLLSLALVCARTKLGLGVLFAGSSPGGALARRLLPAAVVFFMLVGCIRRIEFHENLWSGTAATAVLIVVLLTALTLWSARAIDRNDHGRQRSAGALQLSERHYRVPLENLLDGVALCKMLVDDHGRPADFVYINVNRAFERLTGLENVAGRRATEAIPGIRDSYPELFEIYGRVASTGHSERFEIEFKPFGKWLSTSVYSPEREYFVTVFEDISERKQSESSLRQLAAIVESSEDAIVGTTLDGTVTNWNAGAERLYLYRAEEAIGREATFLAPSGEEGQFQDILDRVRRGEPTHIEARRRRKDGAFISVSLTSSPIRNASGEVIGVSAIARDLTQLKRTEQQLHLQATAMTATAISMVITDREGQILWVNPAFTKLTGYEASEAIGQTLRMLNSGQHDPALHEQMWKTILGGLVWRGEVISHRKDGSCYTEEMTITPVFSTSGRIQHFVAIKQDITVRKSLEEQLRQSQKLEAVGQLAGGVAHDFNNLLQVTILYCGLLADELGFDNPLTEKVAKIRETSQDAARLVSQLLAFSRKQVLRPRVLDLNVIVSEADPMLRRLIREDIELSTVMAANLGHIKVDPTHIMQVLINLATNARDSMPYGGTLRIETQNVTLQDSDIHPTMPVSAGRYVLLHVTDTGTGMDEKTKARIFDPFFTTKDVGKGTGTGLGLASVYGIIRQSNGYIWVDSQIGRGTTFNIYLPVVDEETIEPEQAKREPARVQAVAATVLVVDDSEVVRTLIRQGLEKANYKLLLAADGVEALQVAERYREPIHLLITDVVMPGLRGPELAAQLTASRPEMKVLCMSGYSTNILPQRPGSSADWTFIQKPFELQDLQKKVNELLASVTHSTTATIENLQPPEKEPAFFRRPPATNGIVG